jgi:serpin B
MKKLIILVLSALLFTACGGINEPNGVYDTEPTVQPAAPNFVRPVAAVMEVKDVPDSTWAAIADFSQELFRRVLEMSEEENPVISPLSAYYALAMVSMGANGATLDEFTNLLRRSPADLAPELAGLAVSLMDVHGSTALDLAGSVWVRDTHNVHPDFDRVMADYFGAPAFSRAFDDDTVAEVNGWIYDKTNGLIDEFLDEFGPDEIMLLLNTLYLKTKWAEEFYPMEESTRTFTPADGAAREVPFISTKTVTLNATITEAYDAVLLPYDDGRLGFFMARPKDGTPVRDFAAQNCIADIYAALEQRFNVVVHMPELDMDFEIELNEMLTAMGLYTSFGHGADFSGLLDGDDPLCISRVLQSVRVIVDKEGTEAAAVTGVFMERTSFIIPIEMDFNTPYIYAVYDLLTGIPLFIGVVDNF